MTNKLSNTQTMLNSYYAVIENIREQEDMDTLAISEKIEVCIELSWGGPADGFKIYLDKQSREPVSGCYYYSDWGWYEEEWLRPADLDMIVNYFCIV